MIGKSVAKGLKWTIFTTAFEKQQSFSNVQILAIKVLIAAPQTTGVFRFCYHFYIRFDHDFIKSLFYLRHLFCIQFSNFDKDAFIENNFSEGQIKNGICLTLFQFPEVFSDSVVCGKVKHVLRVASYEFKYTSCEFNFTSYEFKTTSQETKSTSFKIKTMSWEIKSTSQNLNS